MRRFPVLVSSSIAPAIKPFSLPDAWVWDPWFYWDQGALHMFFLKALRNFTPIERHHHASVGHNLLTDDGWEQLPDALAAGTLGAWDDLCIWTGSAFRGLDDKHYLFYTGRSHSEGWTQRIGIAMSTDLVKFERYCENPVLEASGDYYATDANPDGLGIPPACRDPFVIRDPKGKGYRMLFVAQDATQTARLRGCVGQAYSEDMIHWEMLPPLLSPGLYGEMEVPEIYHYHDHYYLLFSCKPQYCHESLVDKHGAHYGMHCFYSSSFEGPYKPAGPSGYVKSPDPRLYNVKAVSNTEKGILGIGWLGGDEYSPDFIGTTSDPFLMSLSPVQAALECLPLESRYESGSL